MTIAYTNISDVTKTEITLQPARERMRHTIATVTSDLYIMVNPITGSSFDTAPGATLLAQADVILRNGDVLTLDANVQTLWALPESDNISSCEIVTGEWSG